MAGYVDRVLLTPDARPPYSAREMTGSGGQVLHVIARDGFTIVATVHAGLDAARQLAAAPDLLAACETALDEWPPGEAKCALCRRASGARCYGHHAIEAAVAKARGA